MLIECYLLSLVTYPFPILLIKPKWPFEVEWLPCHGGWVEGALLPVLGTFMSSGREVQIRRNSSSSLSSESLAFCLLIIAAHPDAALLTCQVPPKCFTNVHLVHPHLNHLVKEGAVIIPVVQMWKLRPTEVKSHAPGHTSRGGI